MQIVDQLQRFLPMLRRGWWVVALTTLFALSVSLYVSSQTTPRYQTSATFLLSPNPLLERETDIFKGVEILDDRLITGDIC